jgi:hypothetical protein
MANRTYLVTYTNKDRSLSKRVQFTADDRVLGVRLAERFKRHLIKGVEGHEQMHWHTIKEIKQGYKYARQRTDRIAWHTTSKLHRCVCGGYYTVSVKRPSP